MNLALYGYPSCPYCGLVLRALDSLRLEKSWGTWAREYRPLYDPFEAGLARFVDDKKNAFIGRNAALKARDSGTGRRRLATFVVDAEDADVGGDEPIFQNGEGSRTKLSANSPAPLTAPVISDHTKYAPYSMKSRK